MQAIDRLRHEAADLMEKYSVPGMVLGVIVEGEALTAALGVNSTAHPLEVTETTLFQIGSTTKMVTATALVRLEELHFERLLPGFSFPHRVASLAGASLLGIANCGSHSVDILRLDLG